MRETVRHVVRPEPSTVEGCTFTVAEDSSGNGYHGLIDSIGTKATIGVTGLVVGDTAVALTSRFVDNSNVRVPFTPSGTIGFDFTSGNCTIEVWMQPLFFADVEDATISYIRTVGNQTNSFDVTSSPLVTPPGYTHPLGGLLLNAMHVFGSPYDPDFYGPGEGASIPYVLDGNPHYFAFTCAAPDAEFPGAGRARIYIDGSEITTYPGIGAFGPGSGTKREVWLARAIFDELAVYEYTLSAGQVAAHYAARGSFAGYTAAVLADSPAGYYHLNDSC